jgi:hypothetical protein
VERLLDVVVERCSERLAPSLLGSRDEFKVWSKRARRAERAWCDERKGPQNNVDIERAFEYLARNVETVLDPLSVPGGGVAASSLLLRQVTSVSLFRLHSFRPAFLWERITCNLFAEGFLQERAEGLEADLSFGETAFAAFALDSDSERDCVVVEDAFASLRASHILFDAVFGLRNCMFLPLRDSRSHAVLALVLLALPLPGLLSSDDAPWLTNALAGYHELFEARWENDLLAEQLDLEGRVSRGVAGSLEEVLLELVPDHASWSMQSMLPVCALLTGNAMGAGGHFGQVQIRSASRVASSSFESMGTFRALELHAYGIGTKDTIPWAEHATELARNETYSLHADRPMRNPHAPVINLIKQLKQLNDALQSSLKWVSAGARERHRRDVLSRVAEAGFRFACDPMRDVKVDGHKEVFREMLRELRAIDVVLPTHLHKSFKRFGDVVRTDDQFRRVWMMERTTLLRLKRPAAEASVLEAFRWQGHELSKFLEVSQGAPTPFAAAALREFSSQIQVLAWCRALRSLLCLRQLAEGETLRMEVDAGVLRDAGGATVAFMSSLLWQGCSAAINIARLQGTRVVVRVHVGNETLESDWEDIVGELPVMAIASTCHEGPRTEAFTSTVAMEMLPDRPYFIAEPALPATASRALEGGGVIRWTPQEGTPKRVRNVLAALEDAFAKSPELAETFRGVDGIAVVPVPPHNERAQTTLNDWSMGDGTRTLLLAGFLEHWPQLHREVPGNRVAYSVDDELPAAARRLVELLRATCHRLERHHRTQGYNDTEGLLSVLLHDAHNANDDRELAAQFVERISSLRDVIMMHTEPARAVELVGALGERPWTAERPGGGAIGRACSRAARKVAAELTRTGRGDPRKGAGDAGVDGDLWNDLADSIEWPVERRVGVAVGPARDVVVMLVENVIANALVAAWRLRNYDAVSDGRVRIRTDNGMLVVENDALPSDASILTGRLRGRQHHAFDRLGLRVIAFAARRLSVGIDVQVQSVNRCVFCLTAKE